MVTLDGQVRTWENMSLGLGSIDRYQETEIDLEEDDAVDKLWKISVSYSRERGSIDESNTK
jgi:hypothetical protein